MSDIRKRTGKKGTTYQVRYPSSTAKTGYAYKTFPTMKAARAWLESGAVQEEKGVKKERLMPVACAVEKWLEICEKEGTDGNEPVTPYTLSNYEYYAEYMRAYTWSKSLQELKPPDIVEFRTWLVLNCPSRYVARKTLAYFKTVIGEQMIRGVVDMNVAIGITIKEDSRYDEPVVVPSEADVIALLRASDQLANSKNAQVERTWRRYRPMMYLAIDTGARPQEYIALANRSVRDDGVMIDRAIEGDGRKISVTKTPSGRRFIETTQGVTVDMINHYRRRYGSNNDHDLVFPNAEGGWVDRRNWQRRGFNRACMEAGLIEEVEDEKTGRKIEKPKYRPYDLRHFYASMLIEHEPNLKKIQRLMGHKNIEQTLNVYGHLIDKRQENGRDFSKKEPGVVGWLS